MSSHIGFDPDALLSAVVVVDKLDAAGRQIDCAIRLFLNDEDPVALHTLTSAAHGIVYDLARQRGIQGSI